MMIDDDSLIKFHGFTVNVLHIVFVVIHGFTSIVSSTIAIIVTIMPQATVIVVTIMPQAIVFLVRVILLL